MDEGMHSRRQFLASAAALAIAATLPIASVLARTPRSGSAAQLVELAIERALDVAGANDDRRPLMAPREYSAEILRQVRLLLQDDGHS